jgi:hypothetical protein
MKAQVNITNQHLHLFIDACQHLQIIYHQIEEREFDTRYELTVETPSILFYLGQGFGFKIATENILS